jgi:hypothetical protein
MDFDEESRNSDSSEKRLDFTSSEDSEGSVFDDDEDEDASLLTDSNSLAGFSGKLTA